MLEDSQKSKPDSLVSIIILNYNGGKLIIECLESIYKTKDSNFEIILIDNNSSDKSHEKCKKLFPEIRLIKNTKNIGMAARNLGVMHSKGDYVVFLDSDTVVDPIWLKSLLESHKKNGEGLYQPLFLEKERKDIISSAGNMINVFGLANSIGRGEKENKQYNEFRKIGYAPGACTFASIKTIKKIGDIEPIFFAYHDDLDYGWRAQILGIQSYYEPKSIVYHYGSPTLEWSSKKFFLLERNRWICLLSLYSTKSFLKILPLLIILETGMGLYFLKKGMGLVKIKSFFSILKLSKKINERKKIIQKNRVVPDKKILEQFVVDFHLQTTKEQEKTSHIIENIIISLGKLAKKNLN